MVLKELQNIMSYRANIAQWLTDTFSGLNVPKKTRMITQSIYRSTYLPRESFDSWGKDDISQR